VRTWAQLEHSPALAKPLAAPAAQAQRVPYCVWWLPGAASELGQWRVVSVDDKDIVAEIGRLADEEHRIERTHVGEGRDPHEEARLSEIAVKLDQCWDLLAQRRARRSAGQDPDEAEVRPVSVVENFLQ
jgi:hypothetical protein